jgi:hypothetical protein
MQLESCFCLQSSAVDLRSLQYGREGDKADDVTNRILALSCMRPLDLYNTHINVEFPLRDHALHAEKMIQQVKVAHEAVKLKGKAYLEAQHA